MLRKQIRELHARQEFAIIGAVIRHNHNDAGDTLVSVKGRMFLIPADVVVSIVDRKRK